MYYNGIMISVTSSTTTLTFTAPSLPDGVFTDTVVVMVTAVSSIGVGPDSDPATAVISGMQLLYNVECLLYVRPLIVDFLFSVIRLHCNFSAARIFISIW